MLRNGIARIVSLLSFAGLLLGQAQGQNQTGGPVYRVNVLEYAERTAQAVNYSHRSGSTTIDFEGTSLLAKANGEAKVESKQGYIEIEVEFDELTPATQFGPEYLTYVMWAVTPEGRANNLGELILSGDRGKLNVTTELQSFGLLVTAEPYFAVTLPSDTVVLQNVVRNNTDGKVDVVNAKFELLKRGNYAKNLAPGTPALRKADKNTPLEVVQAENAIRLARAAGAERYAHDVLNKAVNNFSLANSYIARGKNPKLAIQAARESVQTAEDARLITLERVEEARLTEERRLAAERTNQANQAAADATARADAEAEARRIAELNAERAAADRTRANAAAAQATQRADAEAQARRRAEQRTVLATADADAARQAAARDGADLRERLLQQLNAVLETKQTARGLIVNMSDVLFDVGQSTLNSDAREKLAKVAGIVMAHPDLALQVEGHTDNTGSHELNQRLSESRANSARDFLTAQGISSGSITAKGLGETNPVATNDSDAGRQQNRRVELVISGASINQSGGN